MRKRLFIQLLTATCALRFGFAKIQRRKLPLSTYVHLCPLILAKTHYSKHLQNRIFAQTCNSLLVIWRYTAAPLYNRENNPLPIVLRNPNGNSPLVVSLTRSLVVLKPSATAQRSVVCCLLSVVLRSQSEAQTPILTTQKCHGFAP